MRYSLGFLPLCFVGGCWSKGGPPMGDDTGSGPGETGAHDSDSDGEADSGAGDTGDGCTFVSDTAEAPPCTDCRFTDIAVVGSGACGVTIDGDVVCWGSQYDTHYGLRPSGGSYESVSGQEPTFCALRSDGRACCWSDGSGDQVPTANDGTFTVLAAGVAKACGTMSDGSVQCWGDTYGTPPSGTFTALTVGSAHACGIRDDQSIACWGVTSADCVKDPTYCEDYGQVEDAPIGGTYKFITASRDGSAAIDTSGELTVWGDEYRDAEVDLGGLSLISVGMGTTHGNICGVTGTGDVVCDPYFEPEVTHTLPPTDGPYTKVVVTDYNACALAADGHVDCWGEYITPPP